MKPNSDFRIDIDNYAITANSYNFILNEVTHTGPKTNEPGKEFLAVKGFYGSLSVLLTELLRLKLRKSGAKSIQDLLDALHRSDELIAKINDFKHYRI